MELIHQPKQSKLCGHCCVAMAAGIDLDDAIRLIGHRRGTKPGELRGALSKRGIQILPTQLTRHSELPPRAIVRLTAPRRRNWHWMLLWDGTIYDPAGNAMAKPGTEITSFMEIR